MSIRIRICPACRRVLVYDSNTWGNWYTGPGCGVCYVCKDCKGKGPTTEHAAEDRERELAKLRARVDDADAQTADLAHCALDLLIELPAELPARAEAARVTLRLALDEAEEHVERAGRRAGRDRP